VALGLAYLTDDDKHSEVPWLRWGGLAVLLSAEVLLLSFRFDAATLAGQGDCWARLVELARFLPQLALVTLTATLIFGEPSLQAEIQRAIRLSDRSHVWWPWCLLQIGLFILFVSVTAIVFEQGGALAFIALWAAAWLLLALAVFAVWCFTVFSPAAWFALLGRHRRIVLACIGMGLLSLGAGLLSDQFWRPLGQSTLWFVSGLLHLFRDDTLIIPAELIVGTSRFSVAIAPACSGYEGLGLAWVFVGTFLWWSRKELRWPNAWLLLPVATALMWFSNGLRITTLILIGSWGWKDVALGGFHSQAGWIAFNVIALGVVIVARRSPFFSSARINERGAEIDPTAVYLMPFLALVAAIMVTGAFTSGFDWLYPLRIVAVAVVFAFFAKEYRRLVWKWSWSAAGIGVLVFALWTLLEPASIKETSSNPLTMGLAKLPTGYAAAWLVSRIIGSVLAVPFAEELAFRGYLIRRLQATDFTAVPATQFSWFSLLASSALFGALHPGRWIAATLAGSLYGLALNHRGNVVDAVLAHAVTNALIAVAVLATGRWSLWS